MIPDWLLKVIQISIAFAVSSAAIYWQWTDNNFLIGVWGIIAAIAFTIAYAKIADWFIERRSSKTPLIEDDERWP